MSVFLSDVLARINDTKLAFLCPGCEDIHYVTVDPHPHPWGWNGDGEKPTFTPSVLVQSGHFVPGHQGEDCWCTFEKRFGRPPTYHCMRCHSFVTGGMIQFLEDSAHHLAGQTVPLGNIRSFLNEPSRESPSS